jgi:hypothetical protein
MPIKGLSERRQIPRIGKIRLGIKVQGEHSEYPRAVDYFVVNEDQSTSGAAARAFHAIYGDKPRQLEIMLPVEDNSKFFAQWYKRYGSGTGLICKGDGEMAQEIDKETGEITQHACDPATCEWAAKKHCRAIGSFQFLLYRVPGLGIWQIDTSSVNSILQLNSGIDYVKRLTRSKAYPDGRVAMIPLILAVKSKEVTAEGKKKHVFVMDIASETMKLEDLLGNAQLEPIQLLLPESNEDEAPDDLYPQSMIDKQAASAAAAPNEQPAGAEAAPIEAIWETVDDKAPADEELGRLDAEASAYAFMMVKLNDCWDVLETPPTKRMWVLNSGKDLAIVYQQLLAVILQRQLKIPESCLPSVPAEETPAAEVSQEETLAIQLEEAEPEPELEMEAPEPVEEGIEKLMSDCEIIHSEEMEEGFRELETEQPEPDELAEELLGQTGEKWVAPWEQNQGQKQLFPETQPDESPELSPSEMSSSGNASRRRKRGDR